MSINKTSFPESFIDNIKYIKKIKKEIITKYNFKEKDFRITYFNKLIFINTNLYITTLYTDPLAYNKKEIDCVLQKINSPINCKERKQVCKQMDNFLKISFIITMFLSIEQFFRVIDNEIMKNKDTGKSISCIVSKIKENFSIYSKYEESFEILKTIRNASHNNFMHNKDLVELLFREKYYNFEKGKLINYNNTWGILWKLFFNIQEDNINYITDIIKLINNYDKSIEDPLFKSL